MKQHKKEHSFLRRSKAAEIMNNLSAELRCVTTETHHLQHANARQTTGGNSSRYCCTRQEKKQLSASGTRRR